MNKIKNIILRATVVVTEVKSNPALRDCIHRPPAVPQLSCDPLGNNKGLTMKRIIIIAAIITSCLSACRKGDENITGVPLSKDNLASGIIHSRSVVGNVITEKISGWVRDTSGIGIDHAIVIVSRISDSVYIDIGSLRNAVTGNFSVGWGPVILSVDVNGDGKMYHIYTSNMPQ